MLSIWHPYSNWGFGNLRRTLSAMEELRQEMGSLLEDPTRRRDSSYDASYCDWPNTYLNDSGDNWVIQATVPGLSEKDIEVTVTADTVNLRGQRNAAVPEGYSAHRKERSSFSFSRSFLLPTKVDSEKARASVKNGVLELVLPKVAEAQPRRISVKAN